MGAKMRAIRDNEISAAAMGKNVVKEHLLIFVLGSAIVGLAGAMMVTNDGLFTPGSYRPMRYTFVIWVMVIVGGTGNNFWCNFRWICSLVFMGSGSSDIIIFDKFIYSTFTRDKRV